MPKIKNCNLKITKNDKGTEIVKFKGKFAKKCNVQKALRGKMLNQFRKDKNVTADVVKDVPVDGERLIHIKTMARQMFCERCKDKLGLSDIERETVQGLGSIFYAKCEKCNITTKVYSSEKYFNPVSQGSLFAINTKVALGALNSGLGPTKTNKLLKTLGLPAVSEKTFKVHERLVGPAIEKVAKESCVEAVALEKALTEQNIDELKQCL